MINFFLNHKILLIIVGLIIAGLAWYGLTSGGESTTLLTSETVSDQGPDRDLVSTLLALRAVKLDASIFTDPAFASLKDFSTQIIPEPIGRPNPFAPLSSSVVPTPASTKDAQIFTPGKTGGR